MTEKQIRLASEKEEFRHLNGMLKEHGDMVSSKFAAMCCGNSFYDRAKWMQKKIADDELIKK